VERGLCLVAAALSGRLRKYAGEHRPLGPDVAVEAM